MVPSLPTINEPQGIVSMFYQDNGSSSSCKKHMGRQAHDQKGSSATRKSESSNFKPVGQEALADAVKTEEDIIEFYGKYGQDSPIKFFYCNR